MVSRRSPKPLFPVRIRAALLNTALAFLIFLCNTEYMADVTTPTSEAPQTPPQQAAVPPDAPSPTPPVASPEPVPSAAPAPQGVTGEHHASPVGKILIALFILVDLVLVAYILYRSGMLG